MATKTRLTDTAVKHARPPATGQAEMWDSAIAGFGVNRRGILTPFRG